MREKELRLFNTYDVWLSAYLQIYYQSPSLKIVNGKVVFTFPVSNDLYKFISEFNGNAAAPISDYVDTVKTLRGQMLSMKRGN